MKNEINNHGYKPKPQSKLRSVIPSASRDCSTYQFQCAPLSELEFHNKLTRCPRLGHEITFSYCLQESGNLPCTRIVQCWHPVFDVATFLEETLTRERWQKFTGLPAKDKITNILELIEKAKARKSRI